MSLYNSEATFTNTTLVAQTIGTYSVAPGETSIFWRTTLTGITQELFDLFTELRDNQTTMYALVSDGSLVPAHDGITLDSAQFVVLFTNMVAMMDRASSLNDLLLPVRNVPEQSDGIPLTASAPRVGSEWVVGTHNFTDPVTWFGDSGRSTLETLTDDDSPKGFMFSGTHPNWIDMTTGRTHNDFLWSNLQKLENPTDPHGYGISVYVDGVLATPCPQFSETGGDYYIDHEAGKAVFLIKQTGTITASYSYAQGSTFTVQTRDTSKSLVIEDAEGDFSQDIVMNDALVYAVWGYDSASLTWIKLTEYTYTRISQVLTEARGQYPVCDPLGATEEDRTLDLNVFRRRCRGMYSSRQAVPFKYATSTELLPGLQLRVSLKDNIPYGGEHLTLTFYCTEKDLS
jgi:hypothetical protein